MDKEIAKLARAGRAGLVLDTNVLVVYLVGLYRKEYVHEVIPNTMQPEDFIIIKSFINKYHFDKQIVTPHILAEVSNLTFDKFMNSGRSEYTEKAVDFIKVMLEEYVHKADMLDLDHLPKLGFADSSIIDIAKKNKYLVLTEDFHLAQRLTNEGCLALNLSYIRQLAMAKM